MNKVKPTLIIKIPQGEGRDTTGPKTALKKPSITILIKKSKGHYINVSSSKHKIEVFIYLLIFEQHMVIIIRYGEIALKGLNRHEFEKKLIKNIKDCLKKNNKEYNDIKRIRGRIIINTDEKCDELKKVFGITSFSYAQTSEIDLEKIKEISLKHYTSGTFRISVKRLRKELFESPKIEKEIGSYVVKHTNAKVNLTKPDINIGIEIADKAYIFNKKIKARGGLPIGIEGKVAVLMEDEKSSEAAKRMMKRGCEVVLINPNNLNYDLIKDYAYGFKLEIKKNIPEYIKVIVVSETLNNLKKRTFKDKVILRPLII